MSNSLYSIHTEADWWESSDIYSLVHVIKKLVNPERFCWMALEWGEKIKHYSNEAQRHCFDALGPYLRHQGPHPKEVYVEPVYTPIGRLNFIDENARSYVWQIIIDNYHIASASAGLIYARGMIETHLFFVGPLDYEGSDERLKIFCDEYRDIAGNPFRPVIYENHLFTPDVMNLAFGIHADYAFDRMPILADALEEAGCHDEQVLTHCRGNTKHVRGCWVVDMCRKIRL